MKSVTLDDLARELNISKFSVSRALSGKPGVSVETRRAVETMARELGYRHPALSAGRSISPGSHTVGLLIPRGDAEVSEFWMHVLGGAEAEAKRIGFKLEIRILDGKATPDDCRGLGGVIIAGRRQVESSDHAKAPHDLVVRIGHPAPLEPNDTVSGASWEGGFLIGQHLRDHGHRRIVYVTDRDGDQSRELRYEGLADAVGVRPGRLLLPPGASFRQAIQEEESTRATTAFVCATDNVAFSVVYGLSRLGKDIPGDVSVVGCNDYAQASLMSPQLTTLQAPMRQIGRTAVQVLAQRLLGEWRDPLSRRIEIAQTLIVRETTGPAP